MAFRPPPIPRHFNQPPDAFFGGAQGLPGKPLGPGGPGSGLGEMMPPMMPARPPAMMPGGVTGPMQGPGPMGDQMAELARTAQLAGVPMGGGFGIAEDAPYAGEHPLLGALGRGGAAPAPGGDTTALVAMLAAAMQNATRRPRARSGQRRGAPTANYPGRSVRQGVSARRR
jgi:hypothetical protein